MKREDVKAKIPSLTDDELDWLMNEHGADIVREKNAAKAVQGELDTANATIQTLRDAAKKWDGVDIGKLQKDVSDWENKYNSDIAALRLDNAVDLALLSGKAKNRKATRALLDLDKIRLEGDKLMGLDEQLDIIKKDNPWMFDSENTSTGATVITGGEHGEGGSGEDDGVAAAFAALNPKLKI